MIRVCQISISYLAGFINEKLILTIDFGEEKINEKNSSYTAYLVIVNYS